LVTSRVRRATQFGREMLNILMSVNSLRTEVLPWPHARSVGLPRSPIATYRHPECKALEHYDFRRRPHLPMSAWRRGVEGMVGRRSLAGTVVIDNSSALRMTRTCTLIVPDGTRTQPPSFSRRTSAPTPNCSNPRSRGRAQALACDSATIKLVVVSTYPIWCRAPGKDSMDELFAHDQGRLTPTRSWS